MSVLVAIALLVGILIGSATAGNSTSHGAVSHKSTPTHRTKQLKNATGKSYLQQEESLPNSVTP